MEKMRTFGLQAEGKAEREYRSALQKKAAADVRGCEGVRVKVTCQMDAASVLDRAGRGASIWRFMGLRFPLEHLIRGMGFVSCWLTDLIFLGRLLTCAALFSERSLHYGQATGLR